MEPSENKVGISTSKTSNNEPAIAGPPESKKWQRKTSAGLKVMIQEPSWPGSDQKRESNVVPIIELSPTTGEQLHKNMKGGISFEGDDAKDSDKRSPNDDDLKEVGSRTRNQQVSRAETSQPPSRLSKGEDQVIFRGRGSIRRSTAFLGYTMSGMLALYASARPRMYTGEVESTSRSTIETSPQTSAPRMHFSENIGVQSMPFTTPEPDSLPALEATAFTVVLQEALDFLEILEHIVPAPVNKSWDESYKTIDEMYGRQERPETTSNDGTKLFSSTLTVSQKLQRDRTYIYNVLKGTNKDIKCHQRYDRLEVEVDDIVRILEGERSLEINYEIWMSQVKQLQDLIESIKSGNETEAKNLLASIQQMKNEVDSAIFLNGSKLGHVEQWEDARLEQQKFRHEMKEQELNDALGECERMERADQIVSGEVRTFLQANTNDLEKKIATWVTLRDEEIERVERVINGVKEKIEFQVVELQNLRKLHEERQAFVKECSEEKERLRIETEYWDAVNGAATIIQALWKGYMVRHQLGQYNDLWAMLKKRKRRALAIRKKNEERAKKAAELAEMKLKKMKKR